MQPRRPRNSTPLFIFFEGQDNEGVDRQQPSATISGADTDERKVMKTIRAISSDQVSGLLNTYRRTTWVMTSRAIAAMHAIDDTLKRPPAFGNRCSGLTIRSSPVNDDSRKKSKHCFSSFRRKPESVLLVLLSPGRCLTRRLSRTAPRMIRGPDSPGDGLVTFSSYQWWFTVSGGQEINAPPESFQNPSPQTLKEFLPTSFIAYLKAATSGRSPAAFGLPERSLLSSFASISFRNSMRPVPDLHPHLFRLRRQVLPDLIADLDPAGWIDAAGQHRYF